MQQLHSAVNEGGLPRIDPTVAHQFQSQLCIQFLILYTFEVRSDSCQVLPLSTVVDPSGSNRKRYENGTERSPVFSGRDIFRLSVILSLVSLAAATAESFCHAQQRLLIVSQHAIGQLVFLE